VANPPRLAAGQDAKGIASPAPAAQLVSSHLSHNATPGGQSPKMKPRYGERVHLNEHAAQPFPPRQASAASVP